MGKIKDLRGRLLHNPAIQEGDVSKHVRLMPRNGGWTFRVRIPDDLRPILAKREIWKSLGAVSYREALRLSHAESIKAEALFAAAREKLAGGGAAATVLMPISSGLHKSISIGWSWGRTLFRFLRWSAPSAVTQPRKRRLHLSTEASTTLVCSASL